MYLEVLKLQPTAQIPIRAYDESAAYDLFAHATSATGYPLTITIPPNAVRIIGTGLAMRPPPGHLILICSRSGLATRGIFIANSPGVVDPDYTGEIKVALFNGGIESAYVKHRDRIAQALIVPYGSYSITEVSSFPPTTRGAKGFGSSGA